MCHAKPPEGSPETAASNAHRWRTTRHPFPSVSSEGALLVNRIFWKSNEMSFDDCIRRRQRDILDLTAWNYSKIWLSISFSFGGASFFFPCQSHGNIKQNPARAWQATPQRQVPPHQQVRTKQQPGRCFCWFLVKDLMSRVQNLQQLCPMKYESNVSSRGFGLRNPLREKKTLWKDIVKYIVRVYQAWNGHKWIKQVISNSESTQKSTDDIKGIDSMSKKWNRI